MKLEKRIRIEELKAAIALLDRGEFFTSDEEKIILTEKKTELEKLLPTPPFRPQDSLDLRCSRATVVEELERLQKKPIVIQLLAQLEKETDAARKARIEWTDPLPRLRAVQDRLVRWDQMNTYNLWRANQQEANL